MEEKRCRKCREILGKESTDGYCTNCWKKYHSFNTVATVMKSVALILSGLGAILGIYCILKLELLVIGCAFIIGFAFIGLLCFGVGELIFKMQNIEDNLQNIRN